MKTTPADDRKAIYRSIYMSPELSDQYNRYAQRLNCSLSSIVVRAMKAFIPTLEKSAQAADDFAAACQPVPKRKRVRR